MVTDVENIRQIHGDLGLEVRRVYDGRGLPLRASFLVVGILVRVVGWLEWLRCALFGVRGIAILRRGTGARAPLVIMDWETYSRVVMGLGSSESLPSIGLDLDARALAASEREQARTETGGW